MKKTFLCLLLLFSLFATLAAQESAAAQETEVNEQYEFFSWEPVAKAKQYGVTIEKYDASTEIWNDYKEIKTKDTQVEVLFTPGIYRVSICSYNLIGRKSKGSDWVQFKILEENIPYLNERAFVKNSVWNAPVLFLDRTESLSSSDFSTQDYINYITPDELFGSNTILVKGHNIFSPKTEFYLVPKDDGSGNAYENWCDDRKEQKLNIVYRNSKEYQVIVSYNPETLLSGYYALEVRNPGNNKDSIDILVLDNSSSQISPDKGFEIDEHYSVNSISISKSGTYDFSITGKGLNSAMSFYFEPTTGTYTYPFETRMPRDTVLSEVTGIYKQGGARAQITFSCPVENLRTGYYNLVAKNWDGTTSKFLCLIKRPFDNDYTKEVKKLKTKFNKKTEYVDVTLQDGKFDTGKIYTLVSAYDEVTDSNNKVDLDLSMSGKKLVTRLVPDQLTIAKYALMVEDSYSSNIIWCEIDNTLKISQNKMDQALVEKTFFRPAGKNTEVTLDADEAGSIQFFDSQIEMKKRMPFFFTNMRFDMSFLKDRSVVLNLEFDLLNFQFVSLSTGSEFRFIGDNTEIGAFSVLRFALPNNYFSPYIGVGIGENIIFPEEPISDFNGALSLFKNKNEVYGIAQAGVILFTVLDVRYNLFLNGMLSDSPYFTDSVSFGFVFPLRPYKFKRKVITRAAEITQRGQLEASDYLEPDSNVDDVDIYESTSVGGFEGYENLVSIMIDSTVQVIEENAFRGCKNLESVTFKENFYDNTVPLTIKGSAFADDTQIDTIYLPARTSVVQAGAFARWTNGQNIILEWNSDDTTERNLIGLLNCSASVHYQDGEVFKGSFNTPLDDERNWIKINELNISNVSVYHENQYILGMRVRGFGWKWYRKELDSWINQESPEQALNYLKSGSKISFKVQGDGNSYDFVLTTQDGGYFHYKFKTKEGELTTVEIPYKKLKKYSYSSQRKLDVNNLKMFCIMPMCKDDWNEASFFDFEVTQ